MAVNSLYRTMDANGCLDYREVFTHDRSYAFDEYSTINPDGSGGGMSRIMEINGERIYSKWIFANVTPNKQERFQLSLDDHERECSPDKVYEFEHRYYTTEAEAEMQLFERNRDGLYLWYCKDGQISKKQFLYVHFSRRKISVPNGVIESDNYLFLPPAKIVLLSEPITEAQVNRQMQKNHTAVKWFIFKRNSKVVQITLRIGNKIKHMLRI